MKVLFLSLPTGHGHNKAAKSVMDYLSGKNIECAMEDAFCYINPILSQSVKNAYLVSVKYSPTFYGRIYRLAERGNDGGVVTSIINKMAIERLLKFIQDSDIRVVVCTHIFAALLMTYISQKMVRKIKTIGVITDYTIHPFWEDSCLNYYVTASELLEYQAVKKGLAREKLLHLGIPIDVRFAHKISKISAKRMLGFEDKSTIFLTGGSMGHGKIINLIKTLSESSLDFQIVCVCGFNERLKRRIDCLKVNKKIYNYGFVDNIDVIMDASDCIITKPGGLTTSESLAKCLPMLIVNPIPGQEDRNVEFLMNNGAAVRITKTFSVDEAIYQLFLNSARIEDFRRNIKFLSKPNSARDLGEFIIKIGAF